MSIATIALTPVLAPAGIISTVAGTGTQGYNGDGIPASTAMLDVPSGVTFDSSGNLYFADSNNNRIRKVDLAGMISTMAGTGVGGYNGDGIPATSAMLYVPHGVSFDSTGNLYFADSYNGRVRKVDAVTGLISTMAGNGAFYYNGDGIPATSAALGEPYGIAVDSYDNLYIAERYGNRIRKVDAVTGLISTVAGTGCPSYNGDGIPATLAMINQPYGVSVDSSGNV